MYLTVSFFINRKIFHPAVRLRSSLPLMPPFQDLNIRTSVNGVCFYKPQIFPIFRYQCAWFARRVESKKNSVSAGGSNLRYTGRYSHSGGNATHCTADSLNDFFVIDKIGIICMDFPVFELKFQLNYIYIPELHKVKVTWTPLTRPVMRG